MTIKRLYLCGAGNSEGVRLAIRINRADQRWDEIVVLDDDPALTGTSVVGATIAGPFDLLADAPAHSEVVNNVARTTVRRREAQERIATFGIPFAQLVDPSVDVTGTEIALDCMIFHNATIGAGATVEERSVVFMGAAAGHGSTIGRGCILAPNAVVNARVTLEDDVYVGTNASILPDAVIGAGATIAANSSVMLSEVPPGATVLGVPGKLLMAPGSRPLKQAQQMKAGARG